MSIVWPYCDITEPVWCQQYRKTSPTSLPYHGSFCDITNISAVLWVFLRHHQHLCRIMGLSATSPTSHYGSFCDITNTSVILWIFLRRGVMGLFARSQTSVILWVFLRHQITSRQYNGSFCDIRYISTVVWPFLRHQKDLCDIMNACVVLWVFV